MLISAPPKDAGESAEADCPRVSVVMPVDRAGPFLGPAIASILAQTYRHFELIIIAATGQGPGTGASGLNAAILDLCGDDPRVRLLECPPLGGVALALNLGIGAARGEYIARMDGDDVSLPARLAEQVSFLDAHSRVAVLGCRLRLIDAQGMPLSRRYPYFESNRQIRRILPFRDPLPHPALMLRKSALFAVGGYRYGHCSEDYELFLRMARDPALEFHNLDAVLFEYRRHAGQTTSPGYFQRRFAEMSGYLFTEFLHSRSPKYFVAMAAIHPWARNARKLLLGY